MTAICDIVGQDSHPAARLSLAAGRSVPEAISPYAMGDCSIAALPLLYSGTAPRNDRSSSTYGGELMAPETLPYAAQLIDILESCRLRGGGREAALSPARPFLAPCTRPRGCWSAFGPSCALPTSSARPIPTGRRTGGSGSSRPGGRCRTDWARRSIDVAALVAQAEATPGPHRRGGQGIHPALRQPRPHRHELDVVLARDGGRDQRHLSDHARP